MLSGKCLREIEFFQSDRESVGGLVLGRVSGKLLGSGCDGGQRLEIRGRLLRRHRVWRGETVKTEGE